MLSKTTFHLLELGFGVAEFLSLFPYYMDTKVWLGKISTKKLFHYETSKILTLSMMFVLTSVLGGFLYICIAKELPKHEVSIVVCFTLIMMFALIVQYGLVFESRTLIDIFNRLIIFDKHFGKVFAVDVVEKDGLEKLIGGLLIAIVITPLISYPTFLLWIEQKYAFMNLVLEYFSFIPYTKYVLAAGFAFVAAVVAIQILLVVACFIATQNGVR